MAISRGEMKRAASSIRRRTVCAKVIYSRAGTVVRAASSPEIRSELGNPFEQPDHAHLGSLAVRGHILSHFDLAPVLAVILIGSPQHLFVSHGGTPAQPFLDARRIEEKVFGDHLVVIRTERRNFKMI